MKSSILSSISYGLAGGGTISGDVTISGDLTVSGGGSFDYSEVITGDMKITNTNAGPALEIEQNTSAQYGLEISQNTNKESLYIDSTSSSANTVYIEGPQTTTGNVFSIYANSNHLTTGKLAFFYSSSNTTGTRSLVEITNDDASATGTTALKIQQDSTGPAIVLNAAVGDRSSAPTLAFGDGDTGFYESSDDLLTIAVGGTARWAMADVGGERFGGTGSGGGVLLATGGSSTYASHTFTADFDTGMRRASADVLALHAGGERMILDTNSRISLSNNDSGGTGGEDSTSANTVFGYLAGANIDDGTDCLLYTSPSPRD